MVTGVTDIRKVKQPGMLKIRAKDGGTVLVQDFYQSPYTKIVDPQGDATIKEGANYSILFYKDYQSFYISLLGGDLPTTRSKAEQGFLGKLGISKEEACKLYVALIVPRGVNVKASGADYHLSFCPDGKPLPKNL